MGLATNLLGVPIMDNELFSMSFICECEDNTCNKKLSDEGYVYFIDNYDTSEYSCYSLACKNLIRYNAVALNANYEFAVVPKKGKHVSYAICECGAGCQFGFDHAVYTRAREAYPNPRFRIRHPACQTSIDFKYVVDENPDYLVYEAESEPTLAEINRKTLGIKTDFSAIPYHR